MLTAFEDPEQVLYNCSTKYTHNNMTLKAQHRPTLPFSLVNNRQENLTFLHNQDAQRNFVKGTT